MAFIRTKRIKGILYRYRVESRREDGRVRQRVLEYLGRQPIARAARKATAKKAARKAARAAAKNRAPAKKSKRGARRRAAKARAKNKRK